MLIEHNVAQALGELAEIALSEPTPEPVHHSYFRFEDRAPACLIGHYLARLGMTAEELGCWNSFTVDNLRVGGVLTFRHLGTGIMLREAQDMQDDGMAWPEIVARLRRDHTSEMIG